MKDGVPWFRHEETVVRMLYLQNTAEQCQERQRAFVD
jgi:hypothetical protein